MTALPKTVSEYSRYAAQSFVQTAVFIDDRIYERRPVANDAVKMVVAPKSRKRASKGAEESVAEHAAEPVAAPDPDTSSDTQEIVNHFAKKQIVCSLYQPRKEAGVGKSSDIFPLCKAADIVIIDWDLYGDKGRKARELAEGLIRQAVEDVPEQLRLILIYTGEHNLQAVASELYDAVSPRIGERFRPEEGKDGLVFVTENSRVVVRGKPGGRTRIPPFDRYTVEEKDLADVAVSEFAELASGLLHAATLFGLAEIRKNSRKILSKFNSELDPAFLTHLAMCIPEEDASSHVIPLLVSEIEAVLEDVLPSPIMSGELIRDWCANVWEPGLHLGELFNRNNIDYRQIAEEICTRGFGAAKETYDFIPNPANSKNTRKAAKILLPTGDSDANHRFSHLMASRTFYGDKPKELTLGSIVHDVANDRYLLCVQPVCDSVRLKDDRAFVFVQMTKSNNQDGGSISHVVPGVADPVLELVYQPKSYRCLTAVFKPDGKQQKVVAKPENEQGLFFEDVAGAKYRWIDQMKPSHAQRAVERFASDLSRVGLTESDWLRRLDGKQ